MMGNFAGRAIAALLLGAATMTGCLDNVTEPAATSNDLLTSKVDAPTSSDFIPTGNLSLSGPHYTLNLIGAPKVKSADMTGDDGHRIFVALNDSTQILLSPGEEFMVLDANGTDGEAAFQLPAPDPDNDGVTEYSVYARVLGKRGAGSIRTWATDPATGEVFSVFPRFFVRNAERSTFANVSKELLYVFVDLDGNGSVDRIPLFDDRLEGYLWEFDNHGLKLVQLRFYMVPTELPTTSSPRGGTSAF